MSSYIRNFHYTNISSIGLRLLVFDWNIGVVGSF